MEEKQEDTVLLLSLATQTGGCVVMVMVVDEFSLQHGEIGRRRRVVQVGGASNT